MTNPQNKHAKQSLSAAAIFLSAAIILGGTGVRTRAHAAWDGDPTDQVYIETVSVADAGGVGRTIVEASADAPSEYSLRRSVAVYIDGAKYSGRAFLYKDTTYVGIREFTSTFAGARVSWDDSTGTATAKNDSTTISATRGKEYIITNNRYLWAKTGIVIENGTMYVPIRTLCTAYGASLTWNGNDYSVSIKKGSGTITPGSSFYDTDEVYWLSKIIHAESRGESMTGKIAVGNVVLNRVRSKDYPNTIYGVIFDRKHGVQFSPVLDGSIHLAADADSIIAAKLCLEGYTVSEDILFFINSSIAENMWVTNNRPLMVSIGKHDFYA